MSFASPIKSLLHRNGIQPRRWLTGLVSYPRFLGYVKPQLMRADAAALLDLRQPEMLAVTK